MEVQGVLALGEVLSLPAGCHLSPCTRELFAGSSGASSSSYKNQISVCGSAADVARVGG